MTAQRVDLGGELYTIENDRVAPNRLVYDELFLRTATATVTVAPNKFMRVSFFDLRGGLVHVDFSGHGEMTVTLSAVSPLDPLPRDQGRPVAYVKGSAAIAITGADESTNIGVFAAHRQPWRVPREGVNSRNDGVARIASISISSRDGRFGGVRTGNVNFAGSAGMVGIHAPGVHFAGAVNIGDITAFGAARPTLELGFARDTRVMGGDLRQPNGQPVEVSGIWRLRFVDGRTSFGRWLPARANGAVLLQDGHDVSARIAGSPPIAHTVHARTEE
jgi:hypothetical protein